MRRRTIEAVTLALIFAGSLRMGGAYSASSTGSDEEVLSSREKGHVFEVRKGQGNKIIREFNASGGQKICLTGFGLMSLDQLQSGLKVDGQDVVLNLGDQQQIRIVGADHDIVSAIQIPLDRTNLVATFADEFDVLNIELENSARRSEAWRTNFGYGGVNSYTLANNGELEVYVDPQFSGTAKTSLNLDPFHLLDGKLEITAQPMNENLRQFTWGRSYSSGLLTSRGSFAQLYGVFEIRAKTPRGKGLWPAFWLLPANGSWPPEIDVLEILGDNPQKLYASWHSNVGGIHSSETKAINVPDTSEDFHTYSVYWTKDEIEWFFDDVQIASKPTPQDFHQPMYMLVNLAVGGGWPGPPDASTPFPAKYTIDWVRVYERRDAR
jgi:beta-glucanase (GH16 family)